MLNLTLILAGISCLYLLFRLLKKKPVNTNARTVEAEPVAVVEMQDTVIYVAPIYVAPISPELIIEPELEKETMVMANFEIAYRTIARNEGGYQNFRDDPGNKNSRGQFVGTNWGINARVYEDHIGRPPTVADMKAMTAATAKAIYKRNYWDKIQGDSIRDQQVATIIFDGHVNHGGWGIKMLQEVLGVARDGAVGPITLNAINQSNPLVLFDRYKERRIRFYNYYATVQRPEMKTRWLQPWLNRMAAFVYQGGSVDSQNDTAIAQNSNSGSGTLGLMAAALAAFYLV